MISYINFTPIGKVYPFDLSVYSRFGVSLFVLGSVSNPFEKIDTQGRDSKLTLCRQIKCDLFCDQALQLINPNFGDSNIEIEILSQPDM